MDSQQLEALIARATAEALKELIVSDKKDGHIGLREAVTNATKRILSEELQKASEKEKDEKMKALQNSSQPHIPLLHAPETTKDLQPGRIKLLRCDDEMCEYEDIDDGQIKVKAITKKIVKLKWEEPPTNVLVVKKQNDPNTNSMFEDLVPWLNDKGMVVITEPMVHQEYSKFKYIRTWVPSELPELCRKVHFIICMGGDGTLLFSQALFQNCSVPPILSFAAGSLGFLTTFDFSNHRAIINTFITNGGFLTLRMRLQCQIQRAGEANPERPEFTAMNEVLIDRGPSPFLTRLECYCDGVYTTTVQADGLIIATPTGSTAYSLAAGGSMVHPLVPSILFTPVCPHSLSFRPLIFPDSAVLKIKVPVGSRSSAWLTCDGRSRVELRPNDSVTVRMSEWPVPVVCKTDETSDWFHSVIEILHWNERKQQKPTL